MAGHLIWNLTKVFLHQKYCQEGLSLAQIAAEIGSSKEAVRKGLCRFGIKTRSHGQNHGNPSQVRYGLKLVRGKSLPHLGEKQVIDKIRTYYSSGMSFVKSLKSCVVRAFLQKPKQAHGTLK